MSKDISFWKMVEPDQLFQSVAHPENLSFTKRVIEQMTPDPVWTERIIKQIESGKPETRCFVAWLANELRVKDYLEIGVRRGFTMAMVAARCPDAELYGFDLWMENYAGSGNPGPRFVQSEMMRLGYRKVVHFVSGNSHETLSAFLGKEKGLLGGFSQGKRKKDPTQTFDLIIVDGDHSLLGAYQDLLDILPYCAVGGAVVFDDIAPDLKGIDPGVAEMERGSDPYGWRDLLGVWRAIQPLFPNYRYFEYTKNPPGVGLGFRLC
jgi:predicted O-methyltransferase YrrM